MFHFRTQEVGLPLGAELLFQTRRPHNERPFKIALYVVARKKSPDRKLMVGGNNDVAFGVHFTGYIQSRMRYLSSSEETKSHPHMGTLPILFLSESG